MRPVRPPQSFAPTVLFLALVPRVLAAYDAFAARLTAWEAHRHPSAHDASLALKTFGLAALVAYGGLALSAFVYVPFGEDVMAWVQLALFHRRTPVHAAGAWATTVLGALASPGPTASAAAHDAHGKHGHGHRQLWETDSSSARGKLNASRLQDQMYAITVTNQVVNNFVEVGMPFVTRAVAAFRSGKGIALAAHPTGSANAKKKRVQFEDEAGAAGAGGAGAVGAADEASGVEEREFMERVWREVALPEYTLFADYSEMVTQFGYVALWSTIWPLASGKHHSLSLPIP